MHSVAIIGGGPRGTYALDQLRRELAENPTNESVRIYVLEQTGMFGSGAVYNPFQEDYLLLNTVCGQVTMYRDGQGPTLYEWLKQNHPELDINEDTYPTRAQHGEYTMAGFEEIEDSMPDGVELIKISGTVTDLEPSQRGYKLALSHDLDPHIDVDHVLLSTGNSRNSIKPGSLEEALQRFSDQQKSLGNGARFIPLAYPVERNIETLPDNAEVGVIGLGLTAIDVILAGTVGKGGKFSRRDDGSYEYHPSGRELRITAFSRSGVLFGPRAVNQKGTTPYQARFLTHQAIDMARDEKETAEGHRKLCFKNDVLSLLWKDMEHAYYRALMGDEFADRYLQDANDESARQALLSEVPEEQRLDWHLLMKPTGNNRFASRGEFMEWHSGFLENEIAEARKGNVASPLKAATDVLRDLRDNVRCAVDFGGLTPHGHQRLLRVYERVNNRLAVGPPIESVEMILALAKAGIVDIFMGPKTSVRPDRTAQDFVIKSGATGEAKHVSFVVDARLQKFSLRRDASLIMPNLLKKGIVRPHENTMDGMDPVEPGGLDVTPQHFVIGRDGRVNHKVSALGTPVEGTRWFTTILARPFVDSTAINCARQWATQLVMRMHSIEQDRPGTEGQEVREQDRSREPEKG